MTRVHFPLLLLTTCLAGATGAQDDKIVKKHLDLLQGDWRIESAVFQGNGAPAEVIAKMILTFKGNEVIPSSAPNDVATIKLDPSAKPAAIDLTERNKKVSLGIYALQGDTLKLCFSEAGNPRPKEFASEKGTKNIYMVLKREKK